MPSIWELIINIFKREGDSSADTAKERMKVVLLQDRIKMTPEAKEEIRSDILKVISQYVDIEEGNLQIDIKQDGMLTSLVASMPVKGGRAEITGKKNNANQTEEGKRKKRTRAKSNKKKAVTTKKRTITGKKPRLSKTASNPKKPTLAASVSVSSSAAVSSSQPTATSSDPTT